MVITNYISFSCLRLDNYNVPRNCNCSFYLYNFLNKVNYILGISAYYHDSAAALLENGNISLAVQEERFSRKKNDSSFPDKSIKYILENKKIKLNDIDSIIFYEKPFLKFERLLETHLAFSPFGFKSFTASIPIWLREKLFQKDLIIKELKKIDYDFSDIHKIKFSDHHLSHAASAFYPSPFEKSSILTLDGVGEWSTTTIGYGEKNKLQIFKEINFPHSIGLLYSAFTYYLGFKVNSDEYKVMGLAPYGRPLYKNLILDNLVDVKDDGSFRLNMKYFSYATGLTMTNSKFNNLFGNPVRNNNSEINQFHMDIASSIQNVTEEIVLKICRFIKKEFNQKNLCLAGGVALNCVANGKLYKEKIFENIWIQPAAGDAGGSLGAALAYWYGEKNNMRISDENSDKMNGSYLGPSFTNKEVEEQLKNINAKFVILDDKKIYSETVKALVDGKAIGWFQGKMEFGPRALGSRSIIADPRNDKMQRILNLKVKFRESFRPFAPAIIEEKVSEYFDFKNKSPYMLMVSQINKNKKILLENNEKEKQGLEMLNIKRSVVPAITHVDYSARIQTVNEDNNKKFYNLLKEFYNNTDCPLLVNTSFNVRDEPIVCTIEDAYKCFLLTDIDVLVIENCFMLKEDQI